MKLNPDKELVQRIRKGIKQRGGHCPCVVKTSPDTICPCKDFREKKECACELYIKE